MLMKGLEVAVRYPDPGSRYFQDLDLLADEPEAAQQALLGAGFVELQTGRDYSADQHLARWCGREFRWSWSSIGARIARSTWCRRRATS